MKFFAWFAVATILFLLVARFKPQEPAEPIIPTGVKEAQGQPGADENAPPARTEEQGERDAQKGGSTYFVVPGHALSNAA
ncbi:MAG: hypothetical protein ACRYG7_22300 [Janthinobacterium lividum]